MLKVVVANAEHRPQKGASCGLRLAVRGVHRIHVHGHLVPQAHVPGCMCGNHAHLAPHVGLAAPPLQLAQLRQVLPLCQGGQAAHLAQQGCVVLVTARGLPVQPPLVRLQRLVPSAQLLVPALFELHVEVLLSVRQHTHRCLGLAQLVVDVDEGLNGGLRAGLELQLLVVQRLGKRMALLRQCSQGAGVQGQPLVVMLHEFCQVEQRGHDLGGDGGACQSGLQAAHKLLLKVPV
mmetsp:Transcript_13522/g.28910  ORF Transcript_13522/g.28910 Transcript_13522/m.28910 type:complete len:234 (-) Transcript_13522:500-1201(-)